MTNPRRVLIPLRRLSRFSIKKETYLQASFLFIICGKRGIRTPGTVTRTPHFECGPIDHSGIFPNASAKVAFFLQTTKKKPFFLRYTLHFFCECQKKCILRVFTYCVIENIVVILPSEIICIFNISIRNSLIHCLILLFIKILLL